MFGQGRISFESPNVVDDGDLPPSRPSRQEQTSYSDNEFSLRGHSNYTDDEDLGSRFKPPLRGSRNFRKIKLDIMSSLEDNHEVTKPTFDAEEGVVEFEDEALDDTNRFGRTSSPRSPSMDNARLFAMTMLAETDRRQSERSIFSDDSSVRSAGSSMQWPRRGRRHEFPGLRGSMSQGLEADIKDMIRTREGLLKVQTQRRLCCIRSLIVLVAIGICLCFSIFAANAIRSGNDTLNPGDSENGARLGQVMDIFMDNGISSQEDFQNPLSPQYKALSWLVLEDPERVEVSSDQFIQRYALAVLYFAWDGPAWSRPLNFLSNQHECGWYNSIMDENGEAVAIGVSCDENLQVRSLDMASNNLSGQIPEEIQLLSGLEFLDLRVNSLVGALPPSFAMLSNLEYLDLNYNQLTGSIPAFLGEFTRLKVLGLSQNQLTGALPATLGSLPLKTLAIDDNLLTGDMAAVASMTSLRYLYAGANNFEGPLDQGLLRNLAHLTEVDLSGNAFHADAIPRYLFVHPLLRVLDLHDNQIHGTIPESIPFNHVMHYFSLRGNFISSSIPSQIQNLGALTHLDLESNSLSGTIPAGALAAMTSLSYLFLGKNPMTRAPISDELRNLKSLKELSMDSLHLTGSIPAWLENFSELKLLDLRSNSLTGSVSINFSNLEQLRFLLLNENLLTGEIPTGLGDQPELKVVSLHHNGFYGEASLLCSSESQIELMTTDCESIDCPCCQNCCEGEKCFEDILWDALEHGQSDWEKNFERSDYGFNPQIIYNSLEPKGWD